MRTALLLISAGALHAQTAPEPPQALILAGNGASIVRAGSELPLTAKPGQVLFSGDALKGAATFLSCTAKSEQTLSADADLLLDLKGAKLRAGKIAATKPADACPLPPLRRAIVASQQHTGAAIAVESSREVVTQTFEQRLQQLPAAQRTQLTAELSPLDAAIAANPRDNVKRLARVAALDRAGLEFDAADEMSRVTKDWPDAAELRSRLFVLQEKGGKDAAAAKQAPDTPGATYALLVGISSFKDTRIEPLKFAHEDAIELRNLLQSPRAGGIPPENIVLLVNEKATRAAVQDAIETHLKGRAGKNDTVLMFIASHGAAVQVGKSNKGFIVTFDSNPEDLATSGIPMEDVRDLFQNQLQNAKRLLLYVDVCHAGHVGNIEPKLGTNSAAANTLNAPDLDMFGMLAAQKNQVAVESINYGGGHGAFTYFLMQALNGEADKYGVADGRVTVTELQKYVVDQVQAATVNAQTPKVIGDVDERVMAEVGKPGIQLKEFAGPVMVASRGLRKITPAVPARPLATAAGVPIVNAIRLRSQDVQTMLQQYQAALDQERFEPGDIEGAFAWLARLRDRLQGQDYSTAAAKLKVALESKGDEVLAKYLAGEASPQVRDDFVACQGWFEAAKPLAPNSLLLQARQSFCEGRAAMFSKDYPTAKTLLERSVGLDPERGYAYNALGIIALERADYDGAIPAFREASKRAPYWAYPMHNMALAYVEKGDYESAIRTYQRAMELAPKVPYLPYNLGLLYQRMNRPRDAEAQYRKALALDDKSAQALNALGALKAETGRRAEAEDFYKQALAHDPALLAARYNLGQLVAADGKRGAEAAALWRQNLARDPQHLPSQIALARYLQSSGNAAEAAREYEAIVAAKPDYVAARVALAEVRPADAIAQLEAALKIQPENPEILERVGKAYLAAGRKTEAQDAFRKALALTTDPAAKKRLKKM